MSRLSLSRDKIEKSLKLWKTLLKKQHHELPIEKAIIHTQKTSYKNLNSN